MARADRESENKVERDTGSLLFDLVTSGAAEGQSGGLSVLVFEIGDERYALDVDQTEGVVDCPRITPLPSPPDGMIGVASVRGRMTLVLELAAATGQKPSKRRLILLKGDAQMGLVADRIDGVVSLAASRKRKSGSRSAGEASTRDEGRKERWPVVSSFRQGSASVGVLDVDSLVEM